MNKVKICVVGAGRWGKNHISTLFELDVLGGIVENDGKRRKEIESLYPDIGCFDSLDNAFHVDFDGYIIATPPISHLPLATKILKYGKPVLVEKPLTMSADEANSMQSVLNESNGRLLVGHLLLFHPAIEKMKSMVDDGMIGDIQYMYSNRLNLGVVRKEENVFWSFAPHDISLFQLIFPWMCILLGKPLFKRMFMIQPLHI
jgi:predicted dehydrogenase